MRRENSRRRGPCRMREMRNLGRWSCADRLCPALPHAAATAPELDGGIEGEGGVERADDGKHDTPVWREFVKAQHWHEGDGHGEPCERAYDLYEAACEYGVGGWCHEQQRHAEHGARE